LDFTAFTWLSYQKSQQRFKGERRPLQRACGMGYIAAATCGKYNLLHHGKEKEDKYALTSQLRFYCFLKLHVSHTPTNIFSNNLYQPHFSPTEPAGTILIFRTIDIN
jgi:hypothetical protein